MIIVKSLGGLGNQLFQLAYALDISEKTGKKIFVDTHIYNQYKVRSFSANNLECFKVRCEPLKGKNKLTSIYMQKIYHLYHKLCKSLFHIEKYGHVWLKFFSKYGFIYNFDRFYHKVSFCSERYELYGYYQSEKYFIDNADKVKSLLKVRVEMSVEELTLFKRINENESIAISLRLGDDYIKSKNLNVCTKDFYLKSLLYLMKLKPKAKVYVFSDEIEKAKEILCNIDCTEFFFVTGFNDFQSLRLMYSCQNFIISNSSFSWWGAYLSDYKDKIIIAPDKWYNDSLTQPDIYHKGMMKLL